MAAPADSWAAADTAAAVDTSKPVAAAVDTVWRYRARHLVREPGHQALPAYGQIGVLYLGQWAYYLTGQHENMMENGSFHNWHSNMARPHFDKDSYEFNLVAHSLTGAGYYGYYRAYGNTLGRSLAMSITSSLLFEFTVETITERPSFQDMYQTPILGAVVGMTVEQLSLRCLSSSWAGVRGIGYLLNPFTLVPGSSWQVKFVPELTAKSAGGRLAFLFR